MDDQLLCGDALLVAPIGYPGATFRQVYLPEDGWFDFWSDRLHHGPVDLEVPAPLDRVPLFVRAGTVLPMWPLAQHTGERAERLILHIYPGSEESWLYEDDGQSTEYRQGESRVTRFVCRTGEPKDLLVSVQPEGAYQPQYACWEWRIHGLSRRPARLLVDGQPFHGATFDEELGIAGLETGEIRELQLTL
jgi:alpha-glucosidase